MRGTPQLSKPSSPNRGDIQLPVKRVFSKSNVPEQLGGEIEEQSLLKCHLGQLVRDAMSGFPTEREGKLASMYEPSRGAHK